MKNTYLNKAKDKILIYLVVFIALFGLFGWSTGELFFAQISMLYIPIAPSTALSFLIISICLLILLKNKINNSILLICQFFLILTILFSGVVIYEWIYNPSWDIENIFIKNPESFGKVLIGRMSPLTATIFILEGFSIFLYSLKNKKILRKIFGILIFLSFFISSILLIGYLYNTPLLYGGSTIPVALTTSICFWLISTSLLMLINLNLLPFTLLRKNSIEKKLTKTFFPVIIFLLILNNYLDANIFINFKNPALTSALVLIIAIPLTGFIIIYVSKYVGSSLEKAQKIIEESEHRFSNAIVHAPFPVIIHSEGKILELSNSWKKITGYTIKDIPTIEEWTKKIYSPNKKKSHLHKVEDIQYNGEWIIKSKDNNERIWEVMTNLIGKLPNKKNVFSSMAVDITDRKKYEITLKEKNEELQLAKEKAEEKESLLQLQYQELKTSEEEVKATNEELYLAKEKTEKNKYLLQQKYQELQTSEEEIQAANEELLVTTDALKESNDKLRIAKEKAEESDRLKTEFINNMSHEIRTPMNGILGFSNFLKKSNLRENKRNQYINIIQSSGRQLLRIIDDILEISKLETKQVKAINKEVCLNDLLFNLFSIFDIKAKENKTPLYLKKSLSDEESLIYTDDTKLNTILSNLLENSLKFTQEGFIEFGYNFKKNNGEIILEIYVKDTGIGINEKNQEIIFERFSQEEKELSQKAGGLGLGLSIAKENAKLIGGKIHLKSKKEQGSTFFITIPYKPVDYNIIDKIDDILESKNKHTILIVEDEEINYLYIEALLEDEIEIDFNIIHAKNGKEAVGICEKNPNINLVLMDLKMSEMNGFDATKAIRYFRPQLPIIAQTAYSSKEDKEKALLVGCNDFITKPLDEYIFKQLINKHLIS